MEKYKKIIESKTSWKLAKHRAAKLLLSQSNTNEVRSYIWSLFIKTKDYYYCSLLKQKNL